MKRLTLGWRVTLASGTGSGSDTMKRIAAPMVVGMGSTTVLGLIVLPTLYLIWKGRQVARAARATRLSTERTEP